MSESINAINVIVYVKDSVFSVHSFNDNEAGNKEAEDCFINIVKKHTPDLTNAEIDVCIKDGYFEQGEYQVFISHST